MHCLFWQLLNENVHCVYGDQSWRTLYFLDAMTVSIGTKLSWLSQAVRGEACAWRDWLAHKEGPLFTGLTPPFTQRVSVLTTNLNKLAGVFFITFEFTQTLGFPLAPWHLVVTFSFTSFVQFQLWFIRGFF